MPGSERSVPGKPTVTVDGSLSHLGRAVTVMRGGVVREFVSGRMKFRKKVRQKSDLVRPGFASFGCRACSSGSFGFLEHFCAFSKKSGLPLFSSCTFCSLCVVSFQKVGGRCCALPSEVEVRLRSKGVVSPRFRP